jgi:hypothetical protein
MGRKLPPGEAERRARERSRKLWAGESYKKYDPMKEGFGRPEDWEKIADALYSGVFVPNRSPGTKNPWLIALSLDSLPASLADLTRAFRKAMFTAHPDYGGSNEQARTVLEAYSVLKRTIQS